MGIDYIIRKALELRKPVAVNISFGNTYGGHDGTTLLERYIDDVSNIWKSVFASEPEMKRQVPGILPVELFQKEKRQSSLQFREDSHRSVSRYGKNIRIK